MELNSVALQGEVYGAGVQGNPLTLDGLRFGAFGLVVDGHPIPFDAWPSAPQALGLPGHDFPVPTSTDEAVAQVDGLRSLVNPKVGAEGVVWTATDRVLVSTPDGPVKASIKVISNRYLLKHDR